MAYRSAGRRKSAGRGAGRSRGGYSSRRSTARRSAPRRRSSVSRRRSAPRTQRIVVEFAGASPVREGDVIGLTKKVAAAPRLKPKL